MINILKKLIKKIKLTISTNRLMFTFIVTSLINAWLVRLFTVNNIFALKPVLADIAMVLFITSFGYFFKPKNQFKYLIVCSVILTSICLINTVYYSNYISFASVSLLKTASEAGDYANAIFENILELKDLIFVWQIFALSFVHFQLKKKKYYETIVYLEQGKIRFFNMMIFGLITIGFFISMLSSVDISRLNKQWNRPSIVMEFGVYVYQANDLFTSVKTTVNEMFGYDDAYKTFREYYENSTENKASNKYTNLFKGKNVIVIHGESIQEFTMNLKFNNEELTPNLNKMAREGIYFSNFYSQESVGNSSDSEFTSLTSLLPSNSGTVFMNYFDRDYETILKLLKEKNYYTFSMHANNGSAWNRNVTYKYLGYDDFYYYTKDYTIDEQIGLGLSDKSFFRQSVELISKINTEHKNWYGTLVMLTNHTPFSDIENYSDYSVDYITQQENSNGELESVVTKWLEGTKIGNYLKSVHYADEAIGELFNELETAGLLDNTIVVLYGDHDCKLKSSEFRKLYNSEYYQSVLIDPNDTVGTIDNITYEINRSVPFIIWSKDIVGTKYNNEISEVMGMIDIMPTLSNMLGVVPKYSLGNDIFNKTNNIVVFPSGNWITNKMYYNSSKEEYKQLDINTTVSMDEIRTNNEYAEKLLTISNGIIIYDLIKAYETGTETLNVSG